MGELGEGKKPVKHQKCQEGCREENRKRGRKEMAYVPFSIFLRSRKVARKADMKRNVSTHRVPEKLKSGIAHHLARMPVGGRRA